MVKKAQSEQSGKPGTRTSAGPTALPGMARGSMGSTGVRTFQPRDSEKGLKKEMEYLNSPIFKAYMMKLVPQTPVTDFLSGVKSGT